MTSHAMSGMEEFFDFDQLEHDHGAPSVTAYHAPDDRSFCDPRDVMAMDWAPAPIAPSPPENHVQNVFDNFAIQDQIQWPLVDTLPQALNSGASIIDPISISHYTDADLATEAGLCESPLIPHTAPLSSYSSLEVSSNHRNGNSGLKDPDLAEGTPLSASQVADSGIANSPTVSSNNVQSRAFPNVPLRQASVASWKPASAKRKGPQSRIPLEAKQILEDEFTSNPYPCGWEMDIIAHQANLDVKKVRNWFNNTRARKKSGDNDTVQQTTSDGVGRIPQARLSKDSLEAFDLHANVDTQPPQPLAVYLAQSYQEEAVEFPAVQAAIDNRSLSGSGSSELDDAWSNSRDERRGSVITSVASSEGTAPTTYTVSSSGSRSNISSFGRDRRRGRRRMAWKDSPYNNRPKFNGLDSAGEPQKDLPFFCTFCPRAFKTKYEWVRHEDSVHALRTTWICCDTKTSLLQTCPFCGQMHPDDAHMAGHKYQQCWNKPESQRTFYRRDHFVQHLHHVHFANAKHPSVRVGCQARLMAPEGHNFGCKDLAMTWRRFGAPMKRDDPMLHCGMCGKKSKDWSERCEHVAEHLIARELDRSVWWSERKENHLENLYSASPFESFRCRYCLRIFTDVKEMNAHSHCKVWSCRFLKSFDDVTADNAGPPLCPDFPAAKAHHCHLCGTDYRTPHSEHAQNCHRYRSCNQEFYTSEEAFLQHLHIFHGASQPAQLKGSSVIEQNYLRNKGASFEPVEFNESWQPCLMDLDTTPIGFTVEKPPTTVTHERKDQGHTKKPPARKKAREDSQQTAPAVKPPRQRSDTSTSKIEVYGPRFFRLSTHVPFLSSRIFYTRSPKLPVVLQDDQAVLEEMPKPHVASLVMSAGLVSMAATRWFIKPKQHLPSGMNELTIDEADWPS
ncbi:hypothetical protein DE146DRAFT_462419 [Phaeosphaeria sp. MPI-PUGE-AT-0046c]|nr:hypothetical protein DE146DRAFT_462419 [Phaeosphaeria sp. MPI-PUGE-AT-0046c]